MADHRTISLNEDNLPEVADILGIPVIDLRTMYFMAHMKRVEEFTLYGNRILVRRYPDA